MGRWCVVVVVAMVVGRGGVVCVCVCKLQAWRRLPHWRILQSVVELLLGKGVPYP